MTKVVSLNNLEYYDTKLKTYIGTEIDSRFANNISPSQSQITDEDMTNEEINAFIREIWNDQ